MQNQPFAEAYHIHLAFKNYPVVNVSREMAVSYCQWLTEELNKTAGTKNKYQFRFPARNEWIQACPDDNYEQVYAWWGSTLQNYKGRYLCNLGYISDENIHYNDFTQNYGTIKKVIASDEFFGDNAMVLTPVDSTMKTSSGFII